MRMLPERPNLIQLKKQAKELHHGHRKGDASCCQVLRWVPQLAEATEAEIFNTEISLHDCQNALAREYGFQSWSILRAYMDRLVPVSSASSLDDLSDRWQGVVDLLVVVARAPAALIMRVDDPEIEVFSSSRGEGNPFRAGHKEKLPGSGLFCEQVIRTGQPLQVADANADEQWRGSINVRMGVIAYLGYPVMDATSQIFGTICVLDRTPNAFSKVVHELLKQVKGLMEGQLALMYLNTHLDQRCQRLEEVLKAQSTSVEEELVPICSYCQMIRSSAGGWKRIEEFLGQHKIGFTHSICPSCYEREFPKGEVTPAREQQRRNPSQKTAEK